MKNHPCFPLIRTSAFSLIAGMFLVAIAGCAKKGPDPDDVPATPPGGQSRVAVEQGAAVVKLKPEEIAAIGLKTAVFNRAAHHPTQPAFGVVLDPQSLAASASALAEAQAQMNKASAALDASAAERERAKHLHEDQGNLSAKEFEAAEAAWRVDQAGATAAQFGLRSAKITAVQQWGSVLADWLSRSGAEYRRIETGEDVLLRIAVPGETPEQTPASATVGLPGGRWAEAKFVSPTSQVSPEFQSAGYFFIMKNSPGLLPGMNVNVLLPAAGPDTEGADLPATAVLYWQGKTWVYLETGHGIFSRREIPSGASDGEGGHLAGNLPADKPVVIQGAAALLSEEFKPASADTN
jgi:predicted small lipoprotein YifL